MAQVFVIRSQYSENSPRVLLGVTSTLATAKRLGAESANLKSADEMNWETDSYGAITGIGFGGYAVVIDRCDLLTRSATGFEV